jgi:hypothetical protein
VHVVAVEVFYAGRFLGVCAGGDNHGAGCADDAGCPNGTCDLFRSAPDPTRFFLAPGSLAVAGNVTNSVSGITGVRVAFDTIVDFATTADAAFALEWSLSPVCVGGTRDGLSCDPQNGGDACLTEGGVCDVPFEPVLNVPSNVTISPVTVDGVTEVDIAIADNHVRRRWLKVTVDATQVTSGGVALDGETVGNPIAVPSGDGAPGGDAVFFVGNMPGDVTGDRKTLLADVGATRLQVNPFLTVDITDAYDVDRDGKVLLADVGKARMDVNPFQTLPLIAP